MYNINKGFTLIEIMVVISIASILAAVMYASFSGARQVAVNKTVKSELKEMQLIIELYRAQNGTYPPAQNISVTGCSSTAGGVTISDSDNCASNPVIDGLVPDFTTDFFDPDDSANSNCHLIYQLGPSGTWYKLTAEHCFAGASSASNGVQSDDELARCASICPNSGTCLQSASTYYESYAVYSAGGECR